MPPPVGLPSDAGTTPCTDCDVLIVGGGPAGSSCAWGLRKSNLNVLVLDKAVFPRHKVCAGWITPAVINELQIDLDDYAQNRVLQPITGFRTGCIGGPEIRTDYGRPVSYGIRRCEFDHYLLERSGARLLFGESLRTLRREQDDWIVNDHLRARLVVGAGGHFCPVARLSTAKPPEAEAVVMAQEVEFEMTPDQIAACQIEPETPELFFCPDLQGYGWCFRKGNYLNVGLGREGEQHLSAHVEAFCSFLRSRGKIGGEFPAQFHGHAYKLYRRTPRQVLHDRLLLIGDAAGLAYPQSGEGIRPAIESGLMAASVIRSAGGDYRKDVLHALQEQITGRFGARGRANALAGLLPAKLLQHLAGKLLGTRWFTRHILLDRWFLHRHQPLLRVAP